MISCGPFGAVISPVALRTRPDVSTNAGQSGHLPKHREAYPQAKSFLAHILEYKIKPLRLITTLSSCQCNGKQKYGFSLFHEIE